MWADIPGIVDGRSICLHVNRGSGARYCYPKGEDFTDHTLVRTSMRAGDLTGAGEHGCTKHNIIGLQGTLLDKLWDSLRDKLN